MSAEILICDQTGMKAYLPAVEEGIEWTTQRKGAPGKLTFKVFQDDVLDFTEGSVVQLREGGDEIFFGFVFKQQRGRGSLVSVTAYDQLRYLKNKDTFVYEDIRADQLLEMIAHDYSLKTGVLEQTGYVIRSGVETDVSLFEMIQNALDTTLDNTGELFVLYDDFGKLTLKRLSSMYVGGTEGYLMVDEETGESFDYSSSIDDNTYNKIVLKNESTKKDFIVAHDMEHIRQWGILVYTDTYKEVENGQAKAEALLKLYNQKTRSLKLTKVLGDNRVRAGSMIAVNLNLGDVKLGNFMLVEQCKHTYRDGEHWMDLTLRGGEFVG